MYTEEVFAQMPDSKPIDASNIDEICLRTLDLGMNPVTFLTSLIHPMTKSQVDRSFQRLLKTRFNTKDRIRFFVDSYWPMRHKTTGGNSRGHGDPFRFDL